MLIDSDALLDTLENYLRKHRLVNNFISSCLVCILAIECYSSNNELLFIAELHPLKCNIIKIIKCAFSVNLIKCFPVYYLVFLYIKTLY